MNFEKAYLLIASPSEDSEGNIVSALELAKRRLDAKMWGLWSHTPHQKEIQAGDLCIVYLAGAKGKQFVAYAHAEKVQPTSSKSHIDGNALTDFPSTVLHLRHVHWFEKPISISNLKDQLDFIPKHVIRWGCVLQRGVKRISSQDATTILKAEVHKAD